MEGPREIVPGVYGFGSDLVNWYLVADGDRLTAVDAGLPGFGKRLEADLSAIGHSARDVEAVVLTHSDADHTGLTPVLQEAGARVFIHHRDGETLRTPGAKGGDASPVKTLTEAWRPSFWTFFLGMARAGGARPPRIQGAEHFDDDEVLDVPGHPRVVHTPGHTPGHSAFLFQDHGALFVGDALMTRHPFTGERGPRLMPPRGFNMSNRQALGSLVEIEGLKAEVLLVGHGDPWYDGPKAAVAQAREAAGDL